jgi:hypothetical protein
MRIFHIKRRWMFLGMGLAVYGAMVIYADPLLLCLLVYGVLLWIVAPCAAVALIIFLFAAISRRWLRPPLLLLSSVLVVACAVALALPINDFLQERAVAAAKAYPDRVASLLEQYQREHGTYPARLEQLPSRPHVPRLLRARYGYESDGKHYHFSFSRPAA